MAARNDVSSYGLKAFTLTWLIDKWTGFDASRPGPIKTREFLDSFGLSEDGRTWNPIQGRYVGKNQFGYFRTLDSFRRPRHWGCWGGLDRRPEKLDAPQCARCKLRNECKPTNPTIWVRPHTDRGQDVYRFSASYVDEVLRANGRRHIPLLPLARIFYPGHTGMDRDVAEMMIRDFHFTEEEIRRLFVDVPAGATGSQTAPIGDSQLQERSVVASETTHQLAWRQPNTTPFKYSSPQPAGVSLAMLELTRKAMPLDQFRQIWGSIYDQLVAEEQARAITSISDKQLLQAARQPVRRIQDFLQGRGNDTPKSEDVCDWIQFCYTIGLYREGAALWQYVQRDEVNAWLYERSKKIAAVCRTRIGT